MMTQTICLVTEELALAGQSGGIGGAFVELARLLAKNYRVEILFCPLDYIDDERRSNMSSNLQAFGIGLKFLKSEKYSFDFRSPAARSYAVYKELASGSNYDFIHFHDYKGLGFHSLCARTQRLAFLDSVMIVQLHGPTRWTCEANDSLFTHVDQIKIDFLERESIARADYLVSPSQYLLDWLSEKAWKYPPPERCVVIKNVCSSLAELQGLKSKTVVKPSAVPLTKRREIGELVMFGRHEFRKGFTIFCDALDLLNNRLARDAIRVTFLGRFSIVAEEQSGAILARRSMRWQFPIAILPGHDRYQSAEYLAERADALVIIPSPIENSPYTVLEAIALGKPVITSLDGGAQELLDSSLHGQMFCNMTAEALAEKVEEVLDHGISSPVLSETLQKTEEKWISFHQSASTTLRQHTTSATPLVSLCITHFERPNKLLEAIASVARQSYSNIELIVVDDGSPSADTQRALDDLAPMIGRLGGKLIRRSNGYLGAARNTAAAAANGEYLCFLDDDDIAFPHMIETLVSSALSTGADITNCLNVFMPEARRKEAWPYPHLFESRISYIPTGGPLSLAPIENTFGAATALISRECFEELGGYSEIKGVGHEDYELFVRAAQAGRHIEICPIALYLYEVDRPSMISSEIAP